MLVFPQKWENLKKKRLFLKKKFGLDTNTEIGPWFWFLKPKPGFGRTLPCRQEGFSVLLNIFSVDLTKTLRIDIEVNALYLSLESSFLRVFHFYLVSLLDCLLHFT